MIELDVHGTRVLLVEYVELREGGAAKFVNALGVPSGYGENGLVFLETVISGEVLDKLLDKAGFQRTYVHACDLYPGAFDYRQPGKSGKSTLVAHLSPWGLLYALKAASAETCYKQLDSDSLAFLRRKHEMSDFSEIGWLLHELERAYPEKWGTEEVVPKLLQHFVPIAEGKRYPIEIVVAHIGAQLAQVG